MAAATLLTLRRHYQLRQILIFSPLFSLYAFAEAAILLSLRHFSLSLRYVEAFRLYFLRHDDCRLSVTPFSPATLVYTDFLQPSAGLQLSLKKCRYQPQTSPKVIPA